MPEAVLRVTGDLLLQDLLGRGLQLRVQRGADGQPPAVEQFAPLLEGGGELRVVEQGAGDVVAEEAAAPGVGAAGPDVLDIEHVLDGAGDRKSTRLNSSHVAISYAVFCLKKKRIEFTTI